MALGSESCKDFLCAHGSGAICRVYCDIKAVKPNLCDGNNMIYIIFNSSFTINSFAYLAADFCFYFIIFIEDYCFDFFFCFIRKLIAG